MIITVICLAANSCIPGDNYKENRIILVVKLKNIRKVVRLSMSNKKTKDKNNYICFVFT